MKGVPSVYHQLIVLDFSSSHIYALKTLQFCKVMPLYYVFAERILLSLYFQPALLAFSNFHV